MKSWKEGVSGRLDDFILKGSPIQANAVWLAGLTCVLCMLEV